MLVAAAFLGAGFVVKDDYAAAGIPCPWLATASGRSASRSWMVVALAALTALPVAAGVFGALYASVALAAGLALGFVAWRLAATRLPSWAWLLYKLSGPYLAAVVLAMLIDRRLQPSGLLALLLR